MIPKPLGICCSKLTMVIPHREIKKNADTHTNTSLLFSFKMEKKISKRCIQVTKLPTDRGEIYENSHKKDKTLG